MKSRSERSNIIKSLVDSLKVGSKSIAELHDDTKFDRTVITRNLEVLKESGLVVEEKKGASRVFSLLPTYNPDTYFGLPLTDEQTRDCESIFSLIKDSWPQDGRPLLKTHAQKIFYEVVSKNNLDLPIGWYIHGGIGVVVFDHSCNYSYSGLPEKVESSVRESVEKYSGNSFAWQSKKQQYEEANNQLYLVKEEMFSILYGPKFSSENIEDVKAALNILVKKLHVLTSLIPKVEDEQFFGILEAQQDFVLDLYNDAPELVLSEKQAIIRLFEEFWKYLALHHLKNDLSNYYQKEVLDTHFYLDIKAQEREVTDLGRELQSMISVDKPTDPLFDEFSALIREGHKLPKKEQERLVKEFQEKFDKRKS